VTRDYGLPRERIAVIYNGVDLERFDPAARTALGPRVRHELGITNGARLCVAVGSGFRRKGFDLLLGLWRRDPLPDTVLVLVGDDERLGAYRREAAALPRAASPHARHGGPTPSASSASSPSSRVSAERPPDAAPHLLRGGIRARLGPGVRLADVAPGGDPDRLLTRPDCAVLKLQPKVTVGAVSTPAGRIYVKRYNVFAWRVALASLWRSSPAAAAWQAAAALGARGFATPEPLAAIDVRRGGLLRKSFFITREV